LHKPLTIDVIVAQATHFTRPLQKSPTIRVITIFVAQRFKSGIELINSKSDGQDPQVSEDVASMVSSTSPFSNIKRT
jgi:hypothetical protein